MTSVPISRGRFGDMPREEVHVTMEVEIGVSDATISQ